jgi:integrase
VALTDTFIKNVKHSGKPAGDKHSDGGGMFLHVKASGKYWRMDYAIHGKRNTFAIGVYPAVGLAQARAARDAAKAQLAQGIDPSIAKREAKQASASAAQHTFEAVALAWLKATAHKRTPATAARIERRLQIDVFPEIGRLPIASIKPPTMRAMLDKVTARGVTDTAQRIGKACELVFAYAIGRGLVERDATVGMRATMPQTKKKHHPAITDPLALGALLRAMHAYNGHPCTVVALKLSPLLLVRPGELRRAQWSEIDLDSATWAIPADKMKMRNDHIVPLPAQAVELLRELHSLTGHGPCVFSTSAKADRPMSENTVNHALRAMGYPSTVQTAHGFRATARTILDEVLGERVDLIEHQLAHTVKDANGRAYNRTAHLPARRTMMQRWADYLDRLRTGADIIQLHSKAA